MLPHFLYHLLSSSFFRTAPSQLLNPIQTLWEELDEYRKVEEGHMWVQGDNLRNRYVTIRSFRNGLHVGGGALVGPHCSMNMYSICCLCVVSHCWLFILPCVMMIRSNDSRNYGSIPVGLIQGRVVAKIGKNGPAFVENDQFYVRNAGSELRKYYEKVRANLAVVQMPPKD